MLSSRGLSVSSKVRFGKKTIMTEIEIKETLNKPVLVNKVFKTM